MVSAHGPPHLIDKNSVEILVIYSDPHTVLDLTIFYPASPVSTKQDGLDLLYMVFMFN